ncbi:hypothetical protein CAPTEDRAFT_201575 [Capitella teleta]|uniref:Uncharacterized protein n=1 Tax=Capitella teleta TaxID=283909 RepID=R7T8C9_CAPTE|nr:hypothetical protein CAPTEDRAFT_201575 [Capitella teleta]|eukprot:ELT87640.1 hypothetical protein CAPTEDRAFT_201575 [Capitella teleta]
MSGSPGAHSAIGTSDDPQGVAGGLATLAGLPCASRGPFCNSGSSGGSRGSASSASLPYLESMPSSSTLSSHDSCGISVWLASLAGLLGLPGQESSGCCSPGVSGLAHADQGQESGELVEHLVEPQAKLEPVKTKNWHTSQRQRNLLLHKFKGLTVCKETRSRSESSCKC